jgi:hypothetical protein
MHRYSGRLGRLRAIASVALMTFALFGLTQCRMVGDRLTGVNVETFHSGQATACLRACQAQAAQALIDETRLYLANLRACGNNQQCIQAEFQRHLAALKKIAADLKTCLDGCHHQGGGDGGN